MSHDAAGRCLNMMGITDTIIDVENLSKAYLLGQEEKQDTLVASMAAMVQAPVHNLRRLMRLNTFKLAKADPVDTADILWALKNISFQVKRGECLGIIGPNGAGKSTLLKILSRVTEPTQGRVYMKGRISALLEVGTGFHPELTGRENIYLNGTILGMKKAEIDRKFDAIVDFSGVAKFLDTPVKRYSSGMRVRLAFSVAAHLEPEILIVDEVLAVGDAEFQRKCMGKMQDVTKGAGRTVLFVSHNMAAVRSLCDNAILLESGRNVLSGTAADVVDSYMRAASTEILTGQARFPEADKSSPHMTKAEIRAGGNITGRIRMGESIQLRIYYASPSPLREPKIGFRIIAQTGESIIHSSNRYQGTSNLSGGGESGCLQCNLGMVPLMEGRYTISLWFGNESADTHTVHDALKFEIEARSISGTGVAPNPRTGFLWWPVEYSVETNTINPA